MEKYSLAQLDQYFDRINFNRGDYAAHDTLEFLTALVRQHILQVPFETLALHYSPDREISLDPGPLFDKIVSRRRGGYCFELNTFFDMILRSIGFKTTLVGCRMANRSVESRRKSRWKGLSHMAILVIFKQDRYLVDVGCGIHGSIQPLLLSPEYTYSGITGQDLKLEFKKLAPDADSPPVWVYSKRDGDKKGWEEIYAFADAEFFTSDFHVLSYYTMKASPFTKIIMAQNVYEDANGQTGRYSLLGSQLWKLVGDEQETVQTLETEADRINVLENYFKIFMSDKEKAAIEESEFKLTM